MSAAKWWDDMPTASPLDAALAAEGATGTLAALARSVYGQESSGGKNASTSNAGARGGMQLLPGTFREVAEKGWDIDDPVQNARGGIRYLRKMLDRADGDAGLAAVGYYSGPGGQDKAKNGQAVRDPRNPNAPDTLQYADQVVARMGKDAQQAEKQPQGGEKADWWTHLPIVDQKTPPEAGKQPAQADQKAADKPQATEKPQGDTLADRLLRQAGLGVRAVAGGVMALPGMMADAVAAPINAGLDAVRGQGNGFRFAKTSDTVNSALDALGLPAPQNAAERITGDVVGGVAGGAGLVKAGQALARGGGELARGVGAMLSAGPGAQIAGGGLSAGASGAVREGGGDGVAQLAAGIGGALAPVAVPAVAGAAVRSALLGPGGQKAAAERLAAFDAAGAQPSLGQVTGGRGSQQVENALSRIPGSAGPLARFAERQGQQLEKAVQDLAAELAPGASATSAGESIARGVDGFKQGVRAVQGKLYQALDQHIPQDAPVEVGNTMAALQKLNEGIPGAEAVSRFFINSKIVGVEAAMEKDLAAAANTGTLPFEAVKKLRAMIGREMADTGLASDVPRSKWTALYAAISDDLGVAAKNAGPQAEAAWSWANAYTRTQTERLEQLSSIVGRDAPERIFQAAVSGTAEGDTVARRVISALPRQERREVASALIQRLGRAAPGQQDAEGVAFSSEQFLSNLARMSPSARKTLFGRTDVEGVVEKIGAFAEVAAARREGGRVFNGTGEPLLGSRLGVGTIVGGASAAAALGQPGPLAAAMAVPIAARAGAGVVTSEGLARMVASPAAVGPGVEGATINALAQEGRTADELGPPLDTRGTIARIGDAKTIGEAIKAFEGLDHAEDARRKSEGLRLEIERLRRQRDDARTLRVQAERDRLEAMRVRAAPHLLDD